MRVINKQSLPRVDDSITFLYVEHCRLDQEDTAIAKHDKTGVTHIPIAAITILFIGPGVTITHAAVKAISDCGCTIAWVGEQCLRYYASGRPETHSSKNVLKQARLCMNDYAHMEVVKRMYLLRFDDEKFFADNTTLSQLRGLEGVRVKTAYKMESKRTGIPWYGREYSLSENDWDKTNNINKALSMGTQLLYGLCHAVIVSLGYSTGLGFIHTGRMESFTYDVADIYKLETIVPAAFSAVKAYEANVNNDLNKLVRKECRIRFKMAKIMKRIVTDLDYIFDMELSDFDDPDPSSELWDDKYGVISGGKDYSL